jgi:hypothetical protein
MRRRHEVLQTLLMLQQLKSINSQFNLDKRGVM